MFSLLPNQEKKRLRKEYRLRLLIVALIFFVTATIFGLIFLLPSYLLSLSKESVARDHLKSVQDVAKTNAKPELSAELKAANLQIVELKGSVEQMPIKKILDMVIKDRPEGLKINSFSLTRDAQAGTLLITGIAPTRESLVSFNKTLSAEPLFSKVESPVSELAKSKNIGFSLSITGKF